MPKVDDDFDSDDEAIEAELEAFENGFRRSRRGNAWRTFRGKTVSIFRRDDDYFGWSIADSKNVRYSHEGYEEEEEALAALAEELNVGFH
jgi:hypothetical protein